MKRSFSLAALCTLVLFYACQQTELIPTNELSKTSNQLLESRASETFTLYGGQDIEAGTVTLETTETDLIVTYQTIDDWQLGTTHLYAGSEEGIPTTGNGNPQIGQFPYSQEVELDSLGYPIEPTDIVVYTIPLSEIETTTVEDTTVTEVCTYLKGDCETTSWEAFFPISPDDVFCLTIPDGGTNDESITWASGDGETWYEVDCGIQDFGLSYTDIIEEVMKSQGVNALGGSYNIETVDTDGDSQEDAVRVSYIGCYLGELFISSNCYDHPDGYLSECSGAGQRVIVAPDGTTITLAVDDTENVTNVAPWVFQFAPEAMETVEERVAVRNEAGEWVDAETGEFVPEQAVVCTEQLSEPLECFTVAPHAELFKITETSDGTEIQEETGWAEPTTEFSGNRWGGYNEFCF